MKTFIIQKNGKNWRYFNWKGDRDITVLDAERVYLDTIRIYGHDALLSYRRNGELYSEELVKELINEWLSSEAGR